MIARTQGPVRNNLGSSEQEMALTEHLGVCQEGLGACQELGITLQDDYM